MPEATNKITSAGEQAGKHPRDMREDVRSDAMRALARRRWDKARAAETANAPELVQDAATDGSSAIDRAVVARLEQAAKKGDVAAARELREWRRLDPAQGAGKDALRLALLIGELTAKQKKALHDWLHDAMREPQSPEEADNRGPPPAVSQSRDTQRDPRVLHSPAAHQGRP
jgi:hypothetical protein